MGTATEVVAATDAAVTDSTLQYDRIIFPSVSYIILAYAAYDLVARLDRTVAHSCGRRQKGGEVRRQFKTDCDQDSDCETSLLQAKAQQTQYTGTRMRTVIEDCPPVKVPFGFK